MTDRRQQPMYYDGSSKIDALYSWLSYDLQRMREDLLKELKYSSVQMGSLYQEMNKDKEGSARAITQEIRFSYKQNQIIYDGLAKMLTEDVGGKIESMDAKFTAFQEVRELNDRLYALVSNTVMPKLDNIAAMEALLKNIETAIAALPVDNVDYTRIAQEVGDRMLEIFNEARESQASVVEALKTSVDYDRIINGAAEKVVESLPYPEKVDYRHITKIAEEAAAKVTLTQEKIEEIAGAVAGKVVIPMPEIDYARLADMVAERVAIPMPEIDYDVLAEKVAAKLAESTQQDYDVSLDEDGIDHIASKVFSKVAEAEIVDYDKVYQVAQAAQVMPEHVDYDRIAEIVEKKLAEKEFVTYTENEEVATEEPIVEEVVEEATTEEPVEEIVEEAVAEEPVEEVVEETITEEPVEEAIEEPVVEAVEEVESASEELAIAEITYEEIDNQLVEAGTGLVIRLKKSFTAKIRQSDEKVKAYYSDIKNELTSYKKINSNISWHGDRFNFGRDTVAKINILGKTLCFYLALDPNDPEFKTTVYHQKDVSSQRAYESTPFMVKVKSDAAVKKALRLVGFLAEKIGTEKKEGFETVDYVEQFAYQSTKQLFEEGFIKATKEKKVDLDF